VNHTFPAPSSSTAAALPVKQGDHLQPHVVDIVYAVIKYMPHLDAILLSSDFLSANPDLVPHLSLVKLLLFQFMATHFTTPSIFLLPPDDDPTRNRPNATVRWAADMLVDHKTKLHAAYARLRIAHQASGATDAQRLASLVDWSALKAVEEAPVAFRVRVSPKALLEAITACLPTWDPQEDVVWDKAQEDLIRVPAHLVGELLASPIVKSAGVVVQDACAGVPVQIVVDWLVPRVQRMYEEDQEDEGEPVKMVVLDTRANHGKNPSPVVPRLCSQAGNLPTVANMPWSDSAHLLERDSFLNLDPFDADSDVAPDIIVVDPLNSQSAVLDEKHFLIQEKTPKPIVADEQAKDKLVAGQVDMLQHALKFASAKFVLYTTRSTDVAENQDVVETCLAANKEWRLMTVGELDHGDTRDTAKSDSAVFHEEDGQETAKSLNGEPEPVVDATTWIEIAPNPPNVTCGIFVAVLAKRQVVDSVSVGDAEVDSVDQALAAVSNFDETSVDDSQSNQHVEEQAQAQELIKRAKKKRKQHTQKFSLRAWRASMRGRDVSGLHVQGSAVDVIPLSGQMRALSVGSVRSAEGALRRKSSSFPIVVPWK
ncbi:hypothetical protein BCR44DRAFT_1538994, partial [Catenaria anguillulae PL171]